MDWYSLEKMENKSDGIHLCWIKYIEFLRKALPKLYLQVIFVESKSYASFLSFLLEQVQFIMEKSPIIIYSTLRNVALTVKIYNFEIYIQ